MRVRARLVLFGAILPSAGTLIASLIAGELFAHNLLRSVDDGLRNQAAVESVSLFDAPGGAPHLHPHESPRVEEPTLGNVVIAVYGADGAAMIRFPESAAIPARLPPDERHANPGPHTVVTPDGERRQLVLNLVSRSGEHYALWLATSLEPLHATTRAFRRSTLWVCAALALILLAVQGWQARALSSRIMRVSAHLPKLREGDFESAPPPDDSGDEVADLRAAVVDVAAQLKSARERQERLIANAAHELRTPLGLMRTEIDLALRKERSPAELREALQESRREVDRLAALAQKMLDLAALRGVTLAHQPGDVAAVVAEAVEACRADAEERRVEVQLVAPAEAPATFAPTRLRQAIDNLLSNAIRFAPAGTTVSVRVEREREQWRIVVADRGAGVAERDRERIFEPFFRSRTDGTGSGLGLAIVREVAREHGGACRLEPATTATTFVLEIAAG
jgi:signal transduction histidine kinase